MVISVEEEVVAAEPLRSPHALQPRFVGDHHTLVTGGQSTAWTRGRALRCLRRLAFSALVAANRKLIRQRATTRFDAARIECDNGFQSLHSGAVAQLGARIDGIDEVTGSNPVGSTTDSLQSGSSFSAFPSPFLCFTSATSVLNLLTWILRAAARRLTAKTQRSRRMRSDGADCGQTSVLRLQCPPLYQL
jgi:hypothetical protein